MKKAYVIKNIKFKNDYLLLSVNNQQIKLELSDISVKLVNATDRERTDYKISPSGYGIHWRLIDEDLSINGLLKAYKSKHALQSAI